ncbi:hypothetical protein AB1Y20_010772 [Prymnesium parvum]|uniref:Uncharacterized protein n=1 Tax=Prymnesium parvum TaxID=97485 RepID=A0AB34IPP5_PRYPA
MLFFIRECIEVPKSVCLPIVRKYHRSVGSPEFRRLHEKEPCPWLALAGKCKEKKCRPCASGLSFDGAMVNARGVRAPGAVPGAPQGCSVPQS